MKLIGEVEVNERPSVFQGKAAELADPAQPFCHGVAVKIEVLSSLGRGTAALHVGPQRFTVSKGTNHALKGLVGAFACSYNLLSFRLWSSPDSTVDLWLELMMISES